MSSSAPESVTTQRRIEPDEPVPTGGRRDRIELLPVSLLDHPDGFPGEFARLARRLGINLGWHYLLDLTWIAQSIGNPAGRVVLDAGAGTGVLQWWLADRGAQVISADRLARTDLSIRFRQRYRVRGLRAADLSGLAAVARQRWRAEGGQPDRLLGAAKAVIGSLVVPLWPKSTGMVVLYNQDLADLHDLESDSVDRIVSVSALEHNRLADLTAVVDELERVLKPGGCMLITMAAARQQDWYHEPSRGWCYAEQTLRSAFRLRDDYASDFDRFDQVMAGIAGSDELQAQLSSHYSESGENGMPWGVWDPKYVPVGIMRWKPAD